MFASIGLRNADTRILLITLALATQLPRVLLAQEDTSNYGPPVLPPNLEMISAAEVDSRIADHKLMLEHLHVKDCWKAASLYGHAEIRRLQFRDCWFEGGMDLVGMFCDSSISFDGCHFSREISDGGVDIYVCDALFRQRLHFEKCKFAETLRVVNSMFDESTVFRGCHFLGDVEISGSRFSNPVSFENCWFMRKLAIEDVHCVDRLSLYGSRMSDEATFEAGVFRGGLDISGIALGEHASISLKGVCVTGDVLAARTFSSGSSARSLRVFSDSHFDSLRGVPWADFRRAYFAPTTKEDLAVLQILSKSYRVQGDVEDANSAFLALKEKAASVGSLSDRALHVCMLLSSSWGTSFGRLFGWFGALVIVFGGLYSWILLPFISSPSAGSTSRASSALMRRCLAIARVLELMLASLRITLFQTGEEKQLKRIAGSLGGATLQCRLAVAIYCHRVMATIFFLMLAGFIGAQFSGG